MGLKPVIEPSISGSRSLQILAHRFNQADGPDARRLSVHLSNAGVLLCAYTCSCLLGVEFGAVQIDKRSVRRKLSKLSIALELRFPEKLIYGGFLRKRWILFGIVLNVARLLSAEHGL